MRYWIYSVVLTLCFSHSAQADDARYTATGLPNGVAADGTALFGAFPTDITEDGQISGTSVRVEQYVQGPTPGSWRVLHQAWRWTETDGQQMLAPSAEISIAKAIAADGTIVGAVQTQGEGKQACLWRPGRRMESLVEALGNPEDSIAHGIGPKGTIVGQADGRAFVLKPDGTLSFPLPEAKVGTTSAATAISDTGVVLGQIRRGMDVHGFVWSGGPSVKLLHPAKGFRSLIPTAINDEQAVVGVMLRGTGPTAGFYWSPKLSGTLNTGALEPDQSSVLNDINNDGIAVGYVRSESGTNQAVIWSPSTGYRLLQPTVRRSIGMTLLSGAALNDRGVIAGHGPAGKASGGFVLEPQ